MFRFNSKVRLSSEKNNAHIRSAAPGHTGKHTYRPALEPLESRALPAVSLLNPGFEEIGAQIMAGPPGPFPLYVPLYWNQENNGFFGPFDLRIQSAAAASPFEGNTATDGAHFLRLVSDYVNGDPNGRGAVNQNLGTMNFGENYTVTGDAFQALVDASIIPYAPTVEFRRGSASGPILAATTLNPPLSGAAGSFTLSYAATAADTGQALILRLMTNHVTDGSHATRGGIDRLQLTTSFVQELTLNGTDGDDIFVLRPTEVLLNGNRVLSGTPQQLTVLGGNGDDLFLIEGPALPAILHGGSGNDCFRFANGTGITGALDGGGGDNVLDFTVYETAVSVNLISGSATATGGLATGHIQRVFGGMGDDTLLGDAQGNDLQGNQGNDFLDGESGNDILWGGDGQDVVLGGAGADLLFGQGGRDLLIGGLGADMLSGGSDDDLLIGGTTDWDADRAALDAVLAAWAREGRTYQERVVDLRNGVRVACGQRIRLNPSSVHDDGSADRLWGGDGFDWFFAGQSSRLLDQQKGEHRHVI